MNAQVFGNEHFFLRGTGVKIANCLKIKLKCFFGTWVALMLARRKKQYDSGGHIESEKKLKRTKTQKL